jgi:hypothetical protein
MVLHSSSGSHEQVDSSLELTGLVLDTHSAINRDNSELVTMMLHLSQLCCDLDRQLSSWSQDDRLDSTCSEQIILSQVFDGWQTKGKGLARSCQVSRDKILSLVNRVETVLLDWEEIFVALSLKNFDRFGRNLRII